MTFGIVIEHVFGYNYGRAFWSYVKISMIECNLLNMINSVMLNSEMVYLCYVVFAL